MWRNVIHDVNFTFFEMSEKKINYLEDALKFKFLH